MFSKMRNALAIAVLASLGMMSAGQVMAANFAPLVVNFYTDASRTAFDTEFTQGETLYGRLTLTVEADPFTDPPGTPIISEPVLIFAGDVYDDFGSLVDPSDYILGGTFINFDSNSSPSVDLDFTLEFDNAGEFAVQLFTTVVFVTFPGGLLEILDPNPLLFDVSIQSSAVPAPGALALLGLGLLGLGARRRTA